MWMLGILVLGVPLLMGLVLFLGPVFRLQVNFNIELALFAVALVILALALFEVVRHWKAPKNAVTVGYNYRLVQPSLPIGRYTFELEILYHVREKGSRHTVKQGKIEMKFKRKDHPELLDWCCDQVRKQLSHHRELATASYPGALIALAPEPEPREVEAQIVQEKYSGF